MGRLRRRSTNGRAGEASATGSVVSGTTWEISETASELLERAGVPGGRWECMSTYRQFPGEIPCPRPWRFQLAEEERDSPISFICRVCAKSPPTTIRLGVYAFWGMLPFLNIAGDMPIEDHPNDRAGLNADTRNGKGRLVSLKNGSRVAGCPTVAMLDRNDGEHSG